MTHNAPNWLEDYKDYLPHFKALATPKGDNIYGCFYRACQVYCTEVLGFSLEEHKSKFDELALKFQQTPLKEGVALLNEVLKEYGYTVTRFRRKDLGGFLEEPCIIGIKASELNEPFPTDHWDAVTNSTKLLELAYLALYISKV